MSAGDEDDRLVLVSNIPSEITSTHVRELFSMVGKIVELNFVASQGQCWIEYAKNEGAKAALYLAGTTLGNRQLQVRLKSELNNATAGNGANAPDEEQKAPSDASPSAPLIATTAALPTISTTGGPLLPTPAPLLPSPSNAGTGAPVSAFESLMRQNPALQMLHAAQLQATAPTMVAGAPAMPLSDPTFTSRTVYVGNLGPESSDPLLKAYFAPLGVVVATRFSGDASSSGPRYAFVEFTTQESANAALLWDGRTMIDRSIKVGRAQNSITKFNQTSVVAPVAPLAVIPQMAASQPAPLLPKPAGDSKIAAAMEKVRAAQEAIARKLSGGAAPTPVASATPTAAVPAPEESKETPSTSGSSSHKRSRSRSRSRSPYRPDYAERQRMKREAETHRYGYGMQQQPEFDRWGSDRGSDRDRHRHDRDRHSSSSHRDRYRSRSRDRDHHHNQNSRNRARQRYGPPPSAVPLVWDGFQWLPAPAPASTLPPPS